MMSALMDTGTFNLFISEEAAKKLILWVGKEAEWPKKVNSNEVSTTGMARDVELHIGQWKSKETIEVIPLDDYNFIIGLGFLDRVDALVVSFPDCICILDPRGQCVILVKHKSGHDRKIISVMQVSKGAKKGKVTFLVTLKAENPKGEESDVPMEVA